MSKGLFLYGTMSFVGAVRVLPLPLISAVALAILLAKVRELCDVAEVGFGQIDRVGHTQIAWYSECGGHAPEAT